jgi:hypothetical protein
MGDSRLSSEPECGPEGRITLRPGFGGFEVRKARGGSELAGKARGGSGFVRKACGGSELAGKACGGSGSNLVMDASSRNGI